MIFTCVHFTSSGLRYIRFITHKCIRRVLGSLVSPSQPPQEVDSVHHLALIRHGNFRVFRIVRILLLLWCTGNKPDDTFLICVGTGAKKSLKLKSATSSFCGDIAFLASTRDSPKYAWLFFEIEHFSFSLGRGGASFLSSSEQVDDHMKLRRAANVCAMCRDTENKDN